MSEHISVTHSSSQLSIQQLVKTYDNGHQAVKGVSIDIAKGEFIVLVGPSGCGKSSILRSIAGLEAITSGEIHLAERRIDTLNPANRDIAMVFQNYALYPHMTVYQNLAYGLKNRGVDKETIAKKIEEVAGILKIQDYLERKPSKLSGGQRQRVAMGRAIVRDPKLFLFDEPLSNLDAALRTHMRLEIKKLQRNLGVTSVYVTHDQVEAMTLADRIVVLNGGKIEQIGTPLELYHQPQTKFVAGFIGSPAMNFVDIKLNGSTATMPAAEQFAVNLNTNETSICLGMRPEHLTIGATSHDDIQFEVEIDVIEPLGAQCLIHCTYADQDIVMLVNECDLLAGKRVTLAVSPSQLFFFDNDGLRIEHCEDVRKSA